MDLAQIKQRATDQGLILRGAFHPAAADRVPALADGRPAGTLVLLGNVGGSLWARFSAAPEFADGDPDPLNRWSERVIGALAEAFHAQALFPFGGPPYRPFIAWAKRAEPVSESALGMLIHPEHGLWHAREAPRSHGRGRRARDGPARERPRSRPAGAAPGRCAS